MGNRISFVLAAIVGSYFIYCGQSAMNLADGGNGDGRPSGESRVGTSEGGFVKDARAQSSESCCEARPYTFTRVAEVALDHGAYSAPVDVSAYREFSLFAANCSVSYQFAASATNPLVGREIAGTGTGYAIRVIGPYVQVKHSCAAGTKVLVMGIK